MPTKSQKRLSIPTVRTSLAHKAAVQTALFASVLVSALTLAAFIIAHARLKEAYGTAAFEGAASLSAAMLAIGGILIIATATMARLVSKRLTDPLVSVTKRVSTLGPGHWGYKKSVQTGDEVEVLDSVAADLSSRLQQIYEHLEEEVRDRTEELRIQYEKDRTILQSIDHGLIVVDANGRVTDMNPAACVMMGTEKQSVIGNPVTNVFKLQRSHKHVKDHPVRLCLSSRKPVRSQPGVRLSLEPISGALLPIMLGVTPILRSGKLIGAIAVFSDITEERKIDYLKSEFISLASHQLRTPLSTIEWYIELFTSEGEEELSEGQQEYLDEMGRAAKRMVKLVDALLHTARLEGGGFAPTLKQVDMTKLIKDLGDEFRSLAKEKDVACSVRVPQCKVPMQTDPVLLNIIFQNLFTNAVKYTEKGGSVSLRMEVGKTSVKVSVSDTGIGIPKREHKRVFEKLFRADNVLKVDTDGNGLGLYISKMIMESLGGTILFTSMEGKGSTFTINVPKSTKNKPLKKKK